MMRLFLAMIMLLLLNIPSFAIDAKIEEGSSQAVSILGENGIHIQAEEHYLRVKILLPSAISVFVDIRLVYEPSSRLFWWEYQNINSKKAHIGIKHPATVYLTGTKMVGFGYSDGAIWVLESSERYSSLANGKASVIAILKENSSKIEHDKAVYIFDWQMIEAGRIMSKALSFEFFYFSGATTHGPKLIDIKKDKDWHLIFEGVNKAKAEVILSDDYKVISVALLPDNKPQDSK